jgi:hypothetical protein
MDYLSILNQINIYTTMITTTVTAILIAIYSTFQSPANNLGATGRPTQNTSQEQCVTQGGSGGWDERD